MYNSDMYTSGMYTSGINSKDTILSSRETQVSRDAQSDSVSHFTKDSTGKIPSAPSASCTAFHWLRRKKAPVSGQKKPSAPLEQNTSVHLPPPQSGSGSRYAGFSHGQSPGSLELAYLGDAIYELYVRRHVLANSKGKPVKKLHRKTTSIVCAHAQCAAMQYLEPYLRPEETAVARRARNAHQTPSKNADIAEYHQATALEAILGHLYLTGQQERLEEIMQKILAFEDTKE